MPPCVRLALVSAHRGQSNLRRRAAQQVLAFFSDEPKFTNQIELGEEAAVPEYETPRRARQATLRDRFVHTLSASQVAAIHFALVTFFFVCRIPFAVIEHWAFVAFVRALAPAYAPALFKRTALATTWVQRLYDETEARTEGLYDAAPGKGTFIIDGFKDRQRRQLYRYLGGRHAGKAAREALELLRVGRRGRRERRRLGLHQAGFQQTRTRRGPRRRRRGPGGRGAGGHGLAARPTLVLGLRTL